MKVITCFSYKGGAGRTTAAANIATSLGSKSKRGAVLEPIGKRTALLDLDVFSAGTHRVFGIKNQEIMEHSPCIQDYLRDQMSPREFLAAGLTPLKAPLNLPFGMMGGDEGCMEDFTLFPARPDVGATAKFVVQKQHENVLMELLLEMETRKSPFDYVILDGEAGIRQMADIALRLADVVLLFFRLTWQHIDGTLNAAKDLIANHPDKHIYLIPTCVPLVGPEDKIYREDASGLEDLRGFTESIPNAGLNEFAHGNPKGAGYFWGRPDLEKISIHDSLRLKGKEQILVFDRDAADDQAARDYYTIARELARLHPPL